MCAEFEINNEKLARIAQGFKIKEESVKLLYEDYQKLTEYLNGQYLAHIIRSMEKYLSVELGYPDFVIKCTPYKVLIKDQKNASSQYRKKQFEIYFNPKMDERDIRDHIAHELGHLFLQAMFDNKSEKYVPRYESTTEPLSSILGLLIISDKNDFYRNAGNSARNHPNWDSVFDSFHKLTFPS